MKKIFGLIFILFLLPAFYTAQTTESGVATNFNGWLMYVGNHKVAPKWSIHTETQIRRHNIVLNWQQWLNRVGVDYKVKPNLMTTAGYAFIISYPYGDQPIANRFFEHRVWEQLILKHSIGRFRFSHRYRLEQRWVQQVATDLAGEPSTTGHTFKQRFRYFFNVNIPLNTNQIEQGTFYLSFYEEVLLNFGPGTGRNILNQNRGFGAIGYQFLPGGNVFLGYLHQWIPKSDGVRFENNHTIQVGIRYNIDFTKMGEGEKD